MSDNPSRIPFHLGGPRVMDSDRLFSIYVSRALDCLGKSQDMVQFRVDCCTKCERLYSNISSNLISFVMAGSKGEGLTAPLESDHDIMAVANTIICADKNALFRSHPAPWNVYEADRRNTSPGYTKLRLDRTKTSKMETVFKHLLLKDYNGHLFLPSDTFVEFVINSFHPYKSDRSGPSIVSVGPFRQDFVIAFPCFIPEITQSFIARHRNYGWPNNDQLNVIATLEGHVVPVGYKGSQTAFLEWRICYTIAERFLMRNLNDTQTKIYILLKMVAKTYINLVCKEITSYVLKNIVLWQAECNNIDTFNEELLVNSLIHALFFLRNCIINNSLPSYMIPERNLLSEKLDLGQRQKLVIVLTELINKGGGVLMGCERLRGTMFVLYKAPAVAEQYGWKRDMIEKLNMMNESIISEKPYTGASVEQLLRSWSTDATVSNISKTLINLILSDYRSLMLQGHDALSIPSIYYERLSQWLS